jgi:hypothetical protein
MYCLTVQRRHPHIQQDNAGPEEIGLREEDVPSAQHITS